MMTKTLDLWKIVENSLIPRMVKIGKGTTEKERIEILDLIR